MRLKRRKLRKHYSFLSVTLGITEFLTDLREIPRTNSRQVQRTLILKELIFMKMSLSTFTSKHVNKKYEEKQFSIALIRPGPKLLISSLLYCLSGVRWIVLCQTRANLRFGVRIQTHGKLPCYWCQMHIRHIYNLTKSNRLLWGRFSSFYCHLAWTPKPYNSRHTLRCSFSLFLTVSFRQRTIVLSK